MSVCPQAYWFTCLITKMSRSVAAITWAALTGRVQLTSLNTHIYSQYAHDSAQIWVLNTFIILIFHPPPWIPWWQVSFIFHPIPYDSVAVERRWQSIKIYTTTHCNTSSDYKVCYQNKCTSYELTMGRGKATPVMVIAASERSALPRTLIECLAVHILVCDLGAILDYPWTKLPTCNRVSKDIGTCYNKIVCFTQYRRHVSTIIDNYNRRNISMKLVNWTGNQLIFTEWVSQICKIRKLR